jgi:D-alanyl-D-alanine carboxypeptidase
VDGKKELKFHGTIESIDLTKKILKISGRTVAVDGQTEIENGKANIAIADLKAGETVKVAGTLQLDDSVLAREIKVLAPEAADDDENEAEFVGTIKSLAADTKSLEVTRGTETVTVNTDAHTAFERSDVRIAFGDLHVGDLVKVEGTRQSATVVLSTEIEVLPPHAERIEFKGTITDVNTAKHTLTVGAHTVVVGPETKCEGQVVSCDALQKGDVVEVAGKLNSDGTVQAREINKTAPPRP